MKQKAGCAVILAMLLAPKAAAAEKKPKPETATAEEVRELREMLQAQSEELRQLREEMGRMRAEQQARAASREASDSRLAAVEASSSRQQESFGKLESDVKGVQAAMASSAATTQEDQKRVAALEGTLGRFRFSGDVRVRYENFYQGGTQDRHRERIRLRFGVEGKLGEDFYGGLFLASGAVANGFPSLQDPVSTNETLTSFFERKTVGFDRGWITYQPPAHKWLQVTGGKFAYTWARTPLTFDNDLNPEGFSEKVSFEVKNSVIRNVTVNPMQIMFNEAGGDNDAFAVGGAVSTRLQFGNRLTITPSYSLLNWRNADVIAQAASPLGGGTRIINANAQTNATRNCGAGGEVGCRVTTGSPTREFVSKFLYSDFILDANIKTRWNRWPVRILGEYLKNLNAENKDPLAAGKQDSAFWSEVSIGQTKNKNDLQFGYMFSRIEQDAVISQFNESDNRASTNILQHRLYALWKIRNNVTANYTFFIGRTLDCRLQNAALANGFTCNTTPPFNTEPYLKRMQFDVIYSF
ncbi:MAG TPA: putative porin [Terriglobales bacterium]|nr:putative porin [Terriglobales bacterium]